MTVRYQGGTARLYAKDIDKAVADVRYQYSFNGRGKLGGLRGRNIPTE